MNMFFAFEYKTYIHINLKRLEDHELWPRHNDRYHVIQHIYFVHDYP